MSRIAYTGGVKRNKFALVLPALLAVLLSGCAGSTNIVPEPPQNADFDGVYSVAYTRASGTITIGVRGNQVTVTVDDDAGFYTGTGVTNSRNEFSVTCTSEDGSAITVSGSLTNASSVRRVHGRAVGTISFEYTADFTALPVLSAYANHYQGDSTNNGPIRFDVAADGSVTGQFGNFAISGTVQRSGYFSGTLTGGGPTGQIRCQLRFGTGVVLAKGNYGFSSLRGRWNASSSAG